MALSVNSNPLSTATHFALKRNDDALSASIGRLSSGLRVNKSGDDNAALDISERMRAQTRGLDQAAANTQDAVNFLGTAEAALGEQQAVLQRMRELAVQGASDTLNADDRTAIQGEMDELVKEVNRISSNTEFNTHNMIGANAGTFTFQVGANDGEIHTIATVATDDAALSVDAISVASAAAASTAISDIDAGIKKLSEERNKYGSNMNGLTQRGASLAVQSQNIGASESRFRDVDFAKEASKLSRAQLLQQSSTAMLAQANATPQAVLGLLR